MYLNWIFPGAARFDRTDNNGFAQLAKHLEGLYKSTNFPKDAPPLNVSLYDSGKSRADLWQFAVNVALEKTIEQSNTACRYRTMLTTCRKDQSKFHRVLTCYAYLKGMTTSRLIRSLCWRMMARAWLMASGSAKSNWRSHSSSGRDVGTAFQTRLSPTPTSQPRKRTTSTLTPMVRNFLFLFLIKKEIFDQFQDPSYSASL